MVKVLIVEDLATNMAKAQSVLADLGVKEVDTLSSVAFAIEYLRDVVEGKRQRPELILLDLSLGHESGFEVLRLWKSEPALKNIEIVVWTQMGSLQRQMCELFGLKYVARKWANYDGTNDLRDKLKQALERRKAG